MTRITIFDYNESRFQEKEEISAEQVSLVVGRNYVISFRERVGGVFEPVRGRLRGRKGRIVKHGSDYLAYTPLDMIVDGYFSILEKMGDRIESLEEDLTTDPSPRALGIIQRMKREMIFLRKSIWPLREVVSGLERDESPIIKESTRIFLRDVYDHAIRVIETVEALRDTLGGMLDIYLSSVSNRMNEVMKVLTIIATIFIPLTFSSCSVSSSSSRTRRSLPSSSSSGNSAYPGSSCSSSR